MGPDSFGKQHSVAVQEKAPSTVVKLIISGVLLLFLSPFLIPFVSD